MPSRGVPEARARSATGTRASTARASTPTSEAVVTLGAKEGLAHLLLAIVGAGDCVLSPDPCYPIHRFGVSIAGGEPVPVATGPGRDAYAEIENGARALAAQAQGADRQLPAQPDQRRRRSRLLREGRRAGEARIAVGDLRSRLRGSDARRPSRRPASSRCDGARDVAVEFFTVSKSYSMPGWRVGFCVGNRALVGALTNIKGYLDYGSFAPVQLAAATALTSCDGDVAENRAVYKHRAQLLCDRAGGGRAGRCRCPVASMFVWAPLPRPGGAPGRGPLRLRAARARAGRGLARRRLRPRGRGVRPLRAGRERRPHPARLRRDRRFPGPDGHRHGPASPHVDKAAGLK